MQQPGKNRIMRSMAFPLILVLVLLLSSCGGGTAEPPSPTTAAEPTAAVAPAAEEEETPAPTRTPRPTRTREPAPSATPAEETAPPDDTTTVSDGEAVNPVGGFAVTIPDGWQLAFNSEQSESGVVFMVPEGASTSDLDAGLIAMNAGTPAAVLERAADQPLDDTSLENLLDVFAQEFEQDVTLSEREEITVADAPGLAVNLAGTDDELGDIEGRLVAVQIDEQRVMLIVGAQPKAEWDAALFEDMLGSIRFFEPAPPPTVEETAESEPTAPGEATAVPTEAATPEAGGDGRATEQISADTFPLPETAENVQSVYSGGGGVVMYTTSLNSEQIADFYREAFTAEGATEREILTVLNEGVLNLVFDGWPPAEGKAVVIQTVPLGPEETNVSIRFEDI